MSENNLEGLANGMSKQAFAAMSDELVDLWKKFPTHRMTPEQCQDYVCDLAVASAVDFLTTGVTGLPPRAVCTFLDCIRIAGKMPPNIRILAIRESFLRREKATPGAYGGKVSEMVAVLDSALLSDSMHGKIIAMSRVLGILNSAPPVES